jgi:hypothetical protein
VQEFERTERADQLHDSLQAEGRRRRVPVH